MREPVVADRYYVTFKELGLPTVPCDVEVPGIGIVTLDDADVHWGQTYQNSGFFVRQSRALGGRFVVVSREQPA
ncbi:MAG: hypothetical protein KF884_02510 [Fimbriimonadaceae bacterium]|nr:hypothetical protein [Fimbriimonadaceae bacterium]QYK58968.1 MAG: hypothetical protein KF884_02510 [Fimbriimonadaceae bacterium]